MPHSSNTISLARELLYASHTIKQSPRTDLSSALSLIRQQLQQLRLIAVVPQPIAACQQDIPRLHLHADNYTCGHRPHIVPIAKDLDTAHP